MSEPRGTARSRGRATLKDIADAVGVSINTASRALTGKPDVGARTRERVQEEAARRGYTPNLLARSLVQGRTRTIGLVVTDCTNPFYAVLIRAVEEELGRHGYGLLLATANEDPKKEEEGLRLLAERRVDGLLLTPVRVEARHVAMLSGGAIPTVLLARRPERYRGHFVGTDNVRGARLGVAHLAGLGHRRIAHLTRIDVVLSAVERACGYRIELAARGLAVEPDLIMTAPASVAGGREAVAALLALRPRPTAILTFSDLQAVGVLLGLRERGLSVPEDLSVVGFDDIELASWVTPALTTVAQDIQKIGLLGARMLLDRLAGTTTGRRTRTLAPTLKVRGSSSPPAGA